MPRRPAAVALALVSSLALAGCGGHRSAFRRARAGGPPAGERARFSPEIGDAVFERAVRVAALAGYDVTTCDAGSRRLETSRVELDAPCGATTCLARQTVEVALGYRTARVRVNREVYDGAAHAWVRAESGDASGAARDLLARIFAATGREAAQDPCEAGARLEVSALSLGGAPE